MKSRLMRAYIAGLLTTPLALWLAAMFSVQGSWLGPERDRWRAP